MVGTPEDVIGMWCPFSRFAEGQGQMNRLGELTSMSLTSVNRGRGESAYEATRCMGAKCMAWRWTDPDSLNDGFCGLVPIHPLARA